MTDAHLTIIIGAGHNALVCANYLARGGQRVLCLEAASGPGGMASHRTFAEGFEAPFAHAQFPADANMVEELALARHGYAPSPPAPTTVLDPQGCTLSAQGPELSGQGVAAADADAYRTLRKRFSDFARRLGPVFRQAPPRLKHLSTAELRSVASLALNVRFGLGREGLRELLRVAGMNIYDLLDEQFDDDRVKGLLALEAMQGSAMGPRTPGTVLTWLHRLANARDRSVTVAAGPESCLASALAKALEATGGTVRYGARVQSITTGEAGRASGVTLDNGEHIAAQTVVSGIDPRGTFEHLVGLPRLDTEFARRVTQIRGKGVVAKLHLGLDSLPEFRGVSRQALAGRLLVAPSADYVERAFNPSKYGRISDAPVLEITVPSLTAPHLAPKGMHVMSINASFVPYKAAAEESSAWREEVQRTVMDTLGQYDGGMPARVTCADLMTPLDIERTFGAVGGHWHHGELSMHQSMMLRPLYGAAQYATPIRGLFLCSAGCHPGGDVAGTAGSNAATAILAGKGDA